MPPWWLVWAERLAAVLAEWWQTRPAGGADTSADGGPLGTGPNGAPPVPPASDTPA